MLIEVIPQEEIKQHTSTVEMLKEQMGAIKVTSKEELTTVAVHISNVKKAKAALTGERDKYITPAKQIIQNAKDKYDPLLAVCDEIETMLKGKASTFIVEEDARVKAQTEKELKKVDTGYQKEETAVDKISEIPDAVKSAKVEGGSLSSRKTKTVKIVDQSLIPDEYYKPRELDMVKINKVAKAGVNIPGVIVEEGVDMQFRSA